jgi:glucose-6-phosphate dehydrogenase assembly protein OpcA
MTDLKIVEPSAIQSSLDELWNAKDNKNKIRASLFNLIFFTEQSPREEYIRKIAYKLIKKFPARIFFISSDTESENSLKTSVAVISTEQGEFDITCDLIEISASGAAQERVPLLLLPHIVPDLPVFLVWAEDPTRYSTLYENLKSFATRVIFDSESTEDLESFAKSVLTKYKEADFEIADLNWARLESWRFLMSSTFSKPSILAKLQKTTSLTITFNSQESAFFCHTKIQSIYLQAWLASCLKWKKKHFSPSFLAFSYQSEESVVSVTLEEVKNSTLAPGMIVSLELKTSDGDQFIFRRDKKNPNQIAFEHSTPTECSLITRTEVSKGESGQSLVKEICHKGTSLHYIEALQLIVSGGL